MIPIDFKQALGSVLVIGGCGSLGHIVVDELFDGSDCRIAVLDLDLSRNRRTEADGIQYFRGDISSLEEILPAFRQVKPSVVIYTVSMNGGSSSANAEKLRTVLKACTEMGVKGLVYSSSASVSAGEELVLEDVILSLAGHCSFLTPPPYTLVVFVPSIHTLNILQDKGESLVLAANRSPSLLTMALRPKGVFGTDIDDFEGDAQTVAAMYAAYAHCAAASALISTSKLDKIPPQDDRIDGNAFLVTNDPVGAGWIYKKLA